MKNNFKNQAGPALTQKFVVTLRNRGGFTMIELLIYLALTTVIITIFTAFMAEALKSQRKTINSQAVQQESRFIISRITQEVKTAREVTSVEPQRLTLKNPDNQTIQLYLNSIDGLVYFDNSVQTSPLSSQDIKITQLNFSQEGDIIYINLTAEKDETPDQPGGIYSLSSSSLVVPREKIY
ncbi:MAG: prepilin-type N-terminal cleavage/methylation domain-containing protein [bacterium]